MSQSETEEGTDMLTMISSEYMGYDTWCTEVYGY